MSDKRSESLSSLVGTPLTAVCFVLDYVNLQFEDAFLTALILPSVQVNNTNLAYGKTGYRDMLCDRISHKVTEASETDNEISIKFDDGSMIAILLTSKERHGLETAILQIGPLIRCVWTGK